MTYYLLTNRELEVLSLMAKGYSNVEIEKELLISKSTVMTHICRLYQKLGISEYNNHGGSEYRVRAVLKFFEMQKNGSCQPA